MIKGQLTIEFLIILIVFFSALFSVLVLIQKFSEIMRLELSALNAKDFLNELSNASTELTVLENGSIIHLTRKIGLPWTLSKKGNEFVLKILTEKGMEKQVIKEINSLELEKQLFFEKEVNLFIKKDNEIISVEEHT